MMVQPVPFTFVVAVLLINTRSYGSAENVHCVTPTTTSCSSCPHDTHCATLSEYAQEAELYFTSNTTMVFLPGDHVLDRTISVSNVARLNMRGESSSESIATVVRNGPVGFNFTNIVDLNIYSLAFTSGNKSWGYGPASSSALLLQSILYAKLVNCSFHNCLGTALTVRNTNIYLSENNEFIHNQCACGSFSEMLELGCGITTFNSNLTFIGNTSFLNSTQTAFHPLVNCAGAIWASASSLHFTGTNNFIGNSANGINGVGAIFAQTNTSLSFSGTSNFSHNSAWVGGAIGIDDNVALTFIGTNIFFNNSAESGGAIFTASNTFLSVSGTNEFSHNSAESYGGAIATAENVVLAFHGINNFINNSAKKFGGAIDSFTNAVLTFNGTNSFINNSAESGGAIETYKNGVLTLNGTNNFINNSAEQHGGAIRARKSKLLSFTGISSFCHNAVGEFGGAIYTRHNVTLTFSGTNNFFNNSAESGGAIGAYFHVLLTFNGTNSFINNSAESGGAIDTYEDVIFTFNGTNSFINNLASRGGAVDTYRNSVLIFNGTNNFVNNSANNGGAIHAVSSTSLNFSGASNFSHNSAGYEGGAFVTAGNVELTFTGTNNFCNNSADNGGAIFAVVNTSLSFTGTSSFSRNLAKQGGAISSNSNSILTFNGNISFTNNGHNIRDSRGGAIHLAIGSTSFILPNTTMWLENNYANLGGGIYVLTDDPFSYCKKTQIATFIPRKDCFLQFPGQNLLSDLDVQLVFKNNSAFDAGSVLYGGVIDNCCLHPYDFCNSSQVFNKLFQIEYEADNTTSNISSDPFRVCLCENNSPNCSKSTKTLSVYPGDTVQVSLVTVGQREGIVSSAVRTYLDKGWLVNSQYIQQTTTKCTMFNYTVFSQQNASLELHPDGPCSTVSDKLFIQLSIRQTCPPGFSLENSSVSCVCDLALQKYTNLCNITNGLGQITRETGDMFWAGYDQSRGLVSVHPYCPFDYCVPYTVTFPLNSTLSDMQCAYNRSGFLCGACKGEYSLVLGTNQCRKYTNTHLVLLIPFAGMGVALIFLLFVCKLTVATGTLSGLVFYANIVGVNRTIFLPVESTDVLSVFIAWLNFDFGIETCFYNGMDAYSKTWLQFVFPVYLWLLVGLIILVSHFSQKFAKLLGSNPVSVLATLILLSYAKILRTLITALYITYLEYPTYNRMVWLHDGNIDYLSDKHIPLFLVAMLVFLFLFLPYTLLLVFGQWLQAMSYLRLFSWVNRLKPFMDTYHAPYKPKHRYWPGLLLALRFVLFVAFASNPQQDPNINLLAILVGAGILQLWAWVSGGVYKNWCLDALEGSFTLNLIMLVGTTMHVYQYYQWKKPSQAGSWVYLCYYSFSYIYWHSCLPHLPASEAHQAVEEGA